MMISALGWKALVLLGLLCFLGLGIRLLLHLFLRKYVHHFTVRHVGFLSWKDIEWEGKTVSVDPSQPDTPERTRVHIHKLGLAFGSKNNGSSRWIGFRIDGVTVVSPKSHFARRIQTASRRQAQGQSSPPPAPQDDATWSSMLKSIVSQVWSICLYTLQTAYVTIKWLMPNTISKKIRRLVANLRREYYIPVLNYLISSARIFASALKVGIEVRNAKITIENLLEVQLTTRFGVGVVKSGDQYLAHLFAGLEELHIDNLSDVESNRVLSLPGLFEAHLKFPFVARSPLDVPPSELQEQLRCFRPQWVDANLLPIAHGSPAEDGTQFPAMSIFAHEALKLASAVRSSVQREPSKEESKTKSDGRSSKTRTQPASEDSPLACLRTISISLPDICVRHQSPIPAYVAEVFEHASTPIEAKSVLEGFKATALLGGVFNKADGTSMHHQPAQGEPFDRHKSFIGNGVPLVLSLRVGWKAWATGLTLDTLADDPQAAVKLSISESQIHLTSTWLPAGVPLTHLSLQSTSAPYEPQILCDTMLGSAHLEIDGEQLVRVASLATLRPKEAQNPNPTKGPGSSSYTMSLPDLMLAAVLEGASIRIRGPKEARDMDWPPGEEGSRDAENRWSAEDQLCLDVPTVHFNFTGQHRSLVLHRSDADKRHVRRDAAAGRLEMPLSLRDASLTSFNADPATSTSTAEAESAVSPTDQPTYEALSSPFLSPGPASTSFPPWHIHSHLERHSIICETNMVLATESTVTLSLVSPDHESEEDSQVVRHLIGSFGSIETKARVTVPGWERRNQKELEFSRGAGDIDVFNEKIEVHLWRPKCLNSLQAMVDLLASLPKLDKTASESTEAPKHWLSRLPSDLLLRAGLKQVRLKIAGPDPKFDPHLSRGIFIAANQLTIECFCLKTPHLNAPIDVARVSLRLAEDIRGQAQALILEHSEKPIAVLKAAVARFLVDPIANASVNHRTKAPRQDQQSRLHDASPESETSWEFRGRLDDVEVPPALRQLKSNNRESIIAAHPLAARITFWPSVSSHHSAEGKDVDESLITARLSVTKINSTIDLFHLYCCFVAMSTLKGLSPYRKSGIRSSPPVSRARQARPRLHLEVEVPNTYIHVTLPQQVRVFFHLRRLEVKAEGPQRTQVMIESLLGAVPSPLGSDQWEEFLQLQHWVIRPSKSTGLQIRVAGDTGRLRIPYKFPLSNIHDNAISLVKAVKQLNHQFVHGGLDSVIKPVKEEAKLVPEMQLSLKLLIIDMQDDSFETRLNIIRRVGVQEQVARLERDEAFEDKVATLRRETAGSPTGSANERSNDQTVSFDIARQRVNAYNSTAWIKRIRRAKAEQGKREEALLRRLSGRISIQRTASELPIHLRPHAQERPLMRGTLADLNLTIKSPSKSKDQLADFRADVGSLPRDTAFALLVPLHIVWSMSEFKVQVRDYPMPLLHVPPTYQGRTDATAWYSEATIVIAEEFPGPESVRHIACEAIPKDPLLYTNAAYLVDIPRSAMPTKVYGRPVININSAWPVRFGWGQSIQPTIQDIAKVVEGFSKPSVDPSDRIGFWDKIRLVAHGQIQIVLQPDCDFHINFKGSFDPYALDGPAAGFVKCWRNNVRINIGLPNKDYELVQIISDRYILGVPDLSEYVDVAATGNERKPETPDDDRSTSQSLGFSDAPTANKRYQKDATFSKVMIKLVNGVRWGLGIRLERSCTDQDCSHKNRCSGAPFYRNCRIFDFRPHYTVKTIAPQDEVDGPIDSFAGFRSNFIHMSLSVTSPLPECSVKQISGATNSFHLAPMLSSHFWKWWSLFNSAMSLPIRQGQLFPGDQGRSPKFGRHTATIKYRCDLAPMSLCHSYQQEAAQDWTRGVTAVVAMKGKVDSIKIDLHQREEEQLVRRPQFGDTKTAMHKNFYLAEIHCEGLDLRALSALFADPEKQQVAESLYSDLTSLEDDLEMNEEPKPLTDEELEWIDMDDFRDLGPSHADLNPSIRLIPVLTCPMLTYYRQPASGNVAVAPEGADAESQAPEGADVTRSKFGDEGSHTCLVGCAPDPLKVQRNAAKRRLQTLRDMVEELKDGDERLPLRSGEHKAKTKREELENRIHALETIFQLAEELRKARKQGSEATNASADETFAQRSQEYGYHLPLLDAALHEDVKHWTNRLMMHNPEIQVSNSSRDILLKYYYSTRNRKAAAYQLTSRAVKFIRDLADSQMKQRDARAENLRQSSQSRRRTRNSRRSTSAANGKSTSQEQLIDDLVEPAGAEGWATECTRPIKGPVDSSSPSIDPEMDAAEDLPEEYSLQNTFLCILLVPQFSLRSEADDQAEMVISTLLATLRTFSVTDDRYRDDSVNSLVMHRSYGELKGLQIFYPHNDLTFAGEKKTGKGTFVPFEVLLNEHVDPYDFDRISPATVAMIRYDKFNRLRIRSTAGPSDIGSEHIRRGIDQASVSVGKLSVSANPQQFAAFFSIVTDLILYSDSAHRTRTERLEAALLLHDFSDLEARADVVVSYQERIRDMLRDIKRQERDIDIMDTAERLDFFACQGAMLAESEELSLEIEAIRQAQQRSISVSSEGNSGLNLNATAHELVWHMLSETNIPMIKVAVIGVVFDWLSKSDSTVANTLIIKDMQALNSSPEHLFPEIVGKYQGAPDHELSRRDLFLAAGWKVLPSVGGISIIEKLELHVHPIFLQLERRVGQGIVDYIFSDNRMKRVKDSKTSDSRRERALSFGRNKKDKLKGTLSTQSGSRSSLAPGTYLSAASRSQESLASFSSGASDAVSHRSVQRRSALLPSSSSFTGHASQNGRKRGVEHFMDSLLLHDDDHLDVEEMKLRARTRQTFVLVNFSPTVICLSHKSLGKSSLADVYGLVYRTPTFTYRSQTWSYYDLMQAAKKDVVSSIFRQGGSLISQVLTTARNPKNFARTHVQRLQNPKGLLKFGNKSNGNGETSPKEHTFAENAVSRVMHPSARKDDKPPVKIDREDPPFVTSSKGNGRQSMSPSSQFAEERYESPDDMSDEESEELASSQEQERGRSKGNGNNPEIRFQDASPTLTQGPMIPEPVSPSSANSTSSSRNPLKALRNGAARIIS